MISDESEVTIKVNAAKETVSITYDGQVFRKLDETNTITVKKASSVTNLIVPKSKNYYSLIREKLGWGISQC